MKNKETIKRIEEAKVMFNKKNRKCCSNNLRLEIKKKLIKSYICSVAVCESEIWTVGEM
jgi:hypothetical protein